MKAKELETTAPEGMDWILPASRNKVKIDLVRPLLSRLKSSSKSCLASASWLPLHDHWSVADWRVLEIQSRLRPKGRRCQLDTSRSTPYRPLSHEPCRCSFRPRRAMPRSCSDGRTRDIDRHEYYAEKKRAYEALAAQIERIVNPQPNVIPIRTGAECLPTADRENESKAKSLTDEENSAQVT